MSDLQEALATFPYDELPDDPNTVDLDAYKVVAAAAREHAQCSDPVAAVRRGVESGTIKGDVMIWCEAHHFRRVFQTATDELDGICAWKAWVPQKLDPPSPCRIVDRLVIPVSDGGSET